MKFGKSFSFLLFVILSFDYVTIQSFEQILSDLTNFLEKLTDNVIFTEKCFHELGCFSNGPPYFSLKGRPISLLPQDRDTIGTAFYLYNRRNKSTYTRFTNANEIAKVLQDAEFQGTRRSVIIIHGYMLESLDKKLVSMKDAILDVEDANVFLVTWFHGSETLYDQAVANCRVVGAEIALLVSKLQKDFGVEPKNVHLIGYSLGAQVAGYAGKRIPNLGRITGLDPAGPGFQNVDSSIRLTRTDASLDDNIHTNAASCVLEGGFGTTESIGDIDFFVNGGHHQTGCPAILDVVKEPSFSNIRNQEIFCSHGRAVDLMISSIKMRDCFLVSLDCNSFMKSLAGDCGACGNESSQPNRNCIEMGYFADEHETDGHFNLYVDTTRNEPYCPRTTKP